MSISQTQILISLVLFIANIGNAGDATTNACYPDLRQADQCDDDGDGVSLFTGSSGGPIMAAGGLAAIKGIGAALTKFFGGGKAVRATRDCGKAARKPVTGSAPKPVKPPKPKPPREPKPEPEPQPKPKDPPKKTPQERSLEKAREQGLNERDIFKFRPPKDEMVLNNWEKKFLRKEAIRDGQKWLEIARMQNDRSAMLKKLLEEGRRDDFAAMMRREAMDFRKLQPPPDPAGISWP